MNTWKPGTYHKDPTVNALLNIAASLAACASAQREILYGLKYGKDNGLSIAEAIEVAGQKTGAEIATGLQAVADAIEGRE